MEEIVHGLDTVIGQLTKLSGEKYGLELVEMREIVRAANVVDAFCNLMVKSYPELVPGGLGRYEDTIEAYEVVKTAYFEKIGILEPEHRGFSVGFQRDLSSIEACVDQAMHRLCEIECLKIEEAENPDDDEGFELPEREKK